MSRLYRVAITTEIMVRADSAEDAEQVAEDLDTMDWLDITVSGQMDYHASEVRSVAALPDAWERALPYAADDEEITCEGTIERRTVTEAELEAAGQALLFGGL